MNKINNELRNTVVLFLESEREKIERGDDGVTQDALGKAMGYTSGSVISSYIKGNYQGNVNTVEERLKNYFGFAEKQKEFSKKANHLQPIKPNNYVPIGTSEQIYTAIEYCRLMKGISILHGDAGVGKTMAARKYVKDNKGFAIYIKVQEGRMNRRETIIAVASALGVRDVKNASERYNAIRERLHKAHKVLIFDEAHRFPVRTLEFIRDLSEDDEDDSGNIRDGAGVVLIGNTKVATFIKNVRREDMEQFRNRMIWDDRFLRKQITIDDVRMVFSHLSENEMEKELEILWKISAQQVWGLRGAVNIYNNAVNAGDISYNGLVNACSHSHIGAI